MTAPHEVDRVGGEARGYSWPAFAEGNTAGQRHGAHSKRALRPLVDQLITSLQATAPWTSAPVFAPTVQAWAWAEAAAISYRGWFDDHGLYDENDDETPGDARWDRAERSAARLRAELGLSPASLTRLLSGLSSIDAPAAQSGLEAMKAAGAQLRAAAAVADVQDLGAGVADPPEAGLAGDDGTAAVGAAGSGTLVGDRSGHGSSSETSGEDPGGAVVDARVRAMPSQGDGEATIASVDEAVNG